MSRTPKKFDAAVGCGGRGNICENLCPVLWGNLGVEKRKWIASRRPDDSRGEVVPPILTFHTVFVLLIVRGVDVLEKSLDDHADFSVYT